ncbi:MAG TPA: hypothetical protein VKE98_18120 [Gemmataceae bacterium]|nr:hypothetical protein [Gemmataceae bacterium]
MAASGGVIGEQRGWGTASLVLGVTSAAVLFMLPWFRITSGASGVVGLLSGILGVNRRQGRPCWLSLAGAVVCAAALALLVAVSLRDPAD